MKVGEIWVNNKKPDDRVEILAIYKIETLQPSGENFFTDMLCNYRDMMKIELYDKDDWIEFRDLSNNSEGMQPRQVFVSMFQREE